MNQSEFDARRELAACYRIVAHYGWTSIVYNHISLRLPGTDHYLINPFGLRYDQVTPENLIKIDLDGNKLQDSEWPVNRAGFVIHSAVHKSRPDLHCIIHTHEAWSQSLAATQTKFIPVTQEGCQFYERVGYLSFNGIVLDEQEQQKIQNALPVPKHTLVMENHGLITTGTTCAEAFIRHYDFIRNCQVQLTAMSAGQLRTIPEDVVKLTRSQFEGTGAQASAKVRHPEWPALIDQICPEFLPK